MRIIALLFVLTGWMQAVVAPTVTADFTTNEDEALVFGFAELDALCTIDAARTGYRITTIINGSATIASSASGPWSTPISLPVTLTNSSTQWIRYLPNANVFGNNLPSLLIEATDGSSFSSATVVNIDITSIDDPIAAESHAFVQPGPGPPDYRIREDNVNTWTFQQLRDTLLIHDAEGQPWTLRITGKVNGTLKTAGDVEITSFPTDLTFTALGDVAVKWQPPADVFTKTGPPVEPALVAFTARAVTTTAPITTSSEVTLTTPVLGIADPVLAPTATTLGAIAPLVVTRGTTTTFTYEQLHALCSGTNDVDRVGAFSFIFNGSGVAGCMVGQFNAAGTFVTSQPLPTIVPMSLAEGESLQFVVPDSLATGIRSAGTGSIWVTGSALSYTWVAVSLDVRAGPISGGSDSSSADGGGGGCGAGTAVIGFLLLGLSLSLRRWNQRL